MNILTLLLDAETFDYISTRSSPVKAHDSWTLRNIFWTFGNMVLNILEYFSLHILYYFSKHLVVIIWTFSNVFFWTFIDIFPNSYFYFSEHSEEFFRKFITIFLNFQLVQLFLLFTVTKELGVPVELCCMQRYFTLELFS